MGYSRPVPAGLSLALVLALMAGCAAGPPAPPAPEGIEAKVPEDSKPADAGTYRIPIAGAVLPREERLLPNAVRQYRGGVHEGVDFYKKRDGSSIPCNEPVVNSRAGWVTRADHDWQHLTPEEYDRITELLKENVPEGREGRLDRLRGRQVWVQADDGALMRYCHLNSVAPPIRIGLRISAGVVLGYVGNSGTSSSVRGPWKNCHLHFEIWPKPSAFLGKGKTPEEARALYARILQEE